MKGDNADMLARLRANLPPWFPDSSPALDAVLRGLATAAAWAYSLIRYAELQVRIRTATDGWLDVIAADYFGSALLRAASQSDSAFRTRILLAVLRERATRVALIKVLTDLTGRTPVVIEPTRPADTGGYGLGGAGYGVAGAYGSVLMPYQCFVRAFRPIGTGIPWVAGYGSPSGGYSTPSRSEYASLDMAQEGVSDADIYAAINAVRPAGVTVWANIAT